MRKIRTLLVGSPALSHVVRHLFNDSPDFEIVGSLPSLRSLARQAGRLLPELIVADVKPVRNGVCPVVTAIKQSSPFSKLILTCPIGDLSIAARQSGADACLDQEQLVRRLLPTASALSARIPQSHRLRRD